MSRPRFVAGAVCPQCGLMDRLQVLEDNGVHIRRCVACGHRDGLPVAEAPAPKSRLDPATGQRPVDAVKAQTVRLLDPGRGQEAGKEDRDSGS